MKYELELTPEIDERLSKRASETGEDVVQLIRTAVIEFMAFDGGADVRWTDADEQRRAELIDKDIAGRLSATEAAELAQLDRAANRYFDTIAPPPFEAARRLHRQLKDRATS